MMGVDVQCGSVVRCSLVPGLSHQKLRQDRLQHRQQLDSLLSASKLKDRSRGPVHGPHERGHARKRPRDRSLDHSDREYRRSQRGAL